MNKSYWIIIVLAVALVIIGIRYAMNAGGDKASASSGQEVIDCIMTRTSVRAYKDSVVPDSLVEKMVRAGMAAPCALNQQAWMFVAVTDKALLDSLASVNKYAGMIREAAGAIVVCGDSEKVSDIVVPDEWVKDCSAASENILLAAHALGLGAVWTDVYPDADRVAGVRRVLNMPERYIPLNIIPYGWPKGETVPKDKWKTENVHYNAFK